MKDHLTQVFSSNSILKVMHGCDFDIALFLSDLEVPVVNVFDTSRAFKEMMSQSPHIKNVQSTSFDYLCQVLLNIAPDK